MCFFDWAAGHTQVTLHNYWERFCRRSLRSGVSANGRGALNYCPSRPTARKWYACEDSKTTRSFCYQKSRSVGPGRWGKKCYNETMSTSLADPHVFLIGRPPIGELLGFIRTMAIDGQDVDQGALTNEWRAANDHVLKLECSEAGAADNAPVYPLASALAPLASPILSDPIFQRAYRFVPTDIGVVDLDRLVVSQKFINLAFVNQLKQSLGPTPSPEEVFHAALPAQPLLPSYRMMQNAGNMYTFMSFSTDFRFLEAQLLDPTKVPQFASTGRPVAILGLAIGYGSNFLNVFQVDGRLVLGNGSHRAYAMRDLGIKQVPCLVQRVSRQDELDLVASGDFATAPDRYLKAPRPPMLRDYFDPSLQKIVQVYRKQRSVRLQFGFEQTDIPAQ